jgi:hypothetical protein
MTNPRLSFGEMTVTGELARGVHPADELGLQMALALGTPDPPHPPFAIVPVLLDGHEIGRLEKVQFIWGAIFYQFTSASGNTNFSCADRDAVVQSLEEMLQLAS